MIKILGDFHIHTDFSDGKGSIEAVCREANRVGLEKFAICDHSYRSYFVGMTDEKLEKSISRIKQINEESTSSIDEMKKKKCITALQSVEGNILNFDGDIDVMPSAIKKLDVLHVGFHRFVTKGDGKDRAAFILRNGWTKNLSSELVEKNTEAFVKAVEKYPVDVICHLGHRAKVKGKRIFECAKSNGCHIELNEKHIETLEPLIDEALKSGVKFILGSDAHKIINVGKFFRVKAFIEKHKIPLDRIVGVDCEFTTRKK
ncbi:MAG: PHP domain-containing protein [Acidaminococcus sp.]|nr:PHP domain-containing protein [Acidaminococcus sp.]